MKNFEIMHIIDNEELEERLKKLAERYKLINGWTEKDILQFAVNAMPLTKVWLEFMEMKADELENSINS
ncbi:MAG: hypothetical protein HDQ97_18950 [Lachnospiraceae bacterium]|nr:hypothetical protein [Lachnospiraceae bacterium]